MSSVKRPVLLLTHVAAGDVGQVSVILKNLGYPVKVLRLNKGDQLPANIRDYSGIIAFGGPMSANDDHIEYIRSELDWMPKVVKERIPLLGICLGAQILARSLGADVRKHPDGLYEFGYYPVFRETGVDDLGMPMQLQVFHRHGEAFGIPSGARRLVTRDSFPNQAFRYDDTSFGLQFHPEVNDAVLEFWLGRLPPPVDLKRFGAQSVKEQFAGHARNANDVHSWLSKFLKFWVELRNR